MNTPNPLGHPWVEGLGFRVQLMASDLALEQRA